ncbi:MAG: phosphopantetheine-binding protein, partial [Anaerolineae bacterium]
PGTFVFLEHLPLTPNGKVDRAALPEVDAARPSLARPYAEPQSEIEARLAAIWAEVLDLDQVGIHDDFFSELGGHSLLATQVASRIRDAFQLEIPLRRLFEAPTVAELAASIQLALWSQAGGWPEQGNGEVELEEGEL